VLSALVWQGITASGNPNPAAHHPVPWLGFWTSASSSSGRGSNACWSFRITAGMAKAREPYQRPVAAGVGIGFLATLITWFVAVSIVDDLTKDINALYVQAGTGLLAIIVLLVVMNWFFHKIYWTGWISLHNRRKHELIESAAGGTGSPRRLLLGMGLLAYLVLSRGVEWFCFSRAIG